MIYINPYLSVPINTIIGGVAGSISTKALLATKLGISQSIITRFEIVGSDVHARISSSYSIPANSFKDNTIIKSYLDLQGIVTNVGVNGFENSTVENLKIENAQFGSASLLGCTFLSQSLFNGVFKTNISGEFHAGIFDCKFSVFDGINITNVVTSFAQNNTFLEEVHAKLNVLPQNAFQYATNLKLLDVSQVTSLASGALFQTGFTGILTFSSLTSMLGTTGNVPCKEIHFPILESIVTKNNHFAGMVNCELISARKLKVFGNPSTVSNAFVNLKLNCKIEVNIALKTANAGAADAALVYAKNTRGAIVEFYDDNGNYVSTL